MSGIEMPQGLKPIAEYLQDGDGYGSDVLVRCAACEHISHPTFYVAHLEAGEWLTRCGEDPLSWTGLHCPPDAFLPLDEYQTKALQHVVFSYCGTDETDDRPAERKPVYIIGVDLGRGLDRTAYALLNRRNNTVDLVVHDGARAIAKCMSHYLDSWDVAVERKIDDAIPKPTKTEWRKEHKTWQTPRQLRMTPRRWMHG
jgi:hypothetical protein